VDTELVSIKTKKIILVVLGVVSIFVSALFINPINKMREEYRLTHTEKAMEGSPPAVTFATTALGGFRSLIIDVLWLRALKLMEAAEYFELAQIYTLIGNLEPHFAEVWDHNAWNMAYNISVNFPITPEDPGHTRWKWVQKGIRLLRDKAIPLNTRSAILYKRLSYLYYHKIGREQDEAHFYYKQQLIEQMTNVLGEYVRDIKPIAEAHRDRNNILQREDVKKIQAELKENKINLFAIDLEETGTLPEAARAVLERPENKEAGEMLMRVVRGNYLAEKMNLDPEKMDRLASGFNWLDWRLPETHALFWAEECVKQAEQSEQNIVFYDRMRLNSIRLMFDRGEIIQYSSGEKLPALHDLTKTDVVNEMYHTFLEKYGKQTTIIGGHRNWLLEATVIFYEYGDEKKSRELYREIVRTYKPQYKNVSFEEGVRNLILEDGTRTHPKVAEALVLGSLIKAMTYFEMGNEEMGRELQEGAAAFYDKYQNEFVKGGRERLSLPSFKDLVTVATERYRQRKAASVEEKPSPEEEDSP